MLPVVLVPVAGATPMTSLSHHTTLHASRSARRKCAPGRCYLAVLLQAWMAYLALELLLAVVADVETLADAVSDTSNNTEQLQLAPLASTSE